MSIDLGLEGRTALLCASSHGAGFACARFLARAGASIVLNGRNLAGLEDAADLLCREGASVEIVAADITKVSGLERLLAACPSPDILVTGLGGGVRGWEDGEKASAWYEQRAVAAIELMEMLAPGMAKRGYGRILVLHSVLLELVAREATETGTGVADLIATAQRLAGQHAISNVTVNTVRVGLMSEAEGFHTRAAEIQALARVEQRFGISVPAARLGHPDEIGSFCAFLCSAEAGYLTGQSLTLDGGLSRVPQAAARAAQQPSGLFRQLR
jgi:3-oxoacyl-[acyl-carrier protein] reductase